MSNKSLYVGILMLIMLLPFAAGASRLYVEADWLELGKINTLRFILDNQGQEVYGFQADVQFPYGVEPVKGENGEFDIILSDRADKSESSITSNILLTGALRMGTFSANRTPFSGDNGVIVSMPVYVSDDFDGGDLVIENILLVDRNSNDIPLDPFYLYLNPFIEVSSVWLDESEINLIEGDMALLFAHIEPWNATDQNILWTSSDESIATISFEDGGPADITAIKEGEAIITATASNGIAASCIVRVERRFIDVQGIYLSQDNIDMTEGDAVTINATIDPADATDQTVAWSSSDENIAVVSPDGAAATVTALAPGHAEIHATASNGITATCHVNVEARYIDVTEVILDQTELNLTEGDIATLTATVSPEVATDKTLTWASSDDSVVTVDGYGTVTAVAPGSAEITVTAANGTAASCIVRVERRFIDVQGIYLSQDNIDMTEGDAVTINATIDPADATDQTVAWSSSDENIAVVSPDGAAATVTALAPGHAEIYATASNGLNATCHVNVEARYIDVTEIILDQTELSLTEGDIATLNATVSPEDATDKTLTWASSDDSVVTVDGYGTVTAVAPGSAEITVTASNGTAASCIVRVERRFIDVQGIYLSQDNIDMTEGDAVTINATIDPADATDQTVAWSSSDENIAVVSPDGPGATVTALAPGHAEIHATASNGITATCHVNVEARYIDVTEVILDQTELNLTEGDTATLNATVNPEDATDRTLTWTSSDDSVATVDGYGTVTALAPGSAEITVTASNGTAASCHINVEARFIEVIEITLSDTEIRLVEGDMATLTATVYPADATDKTVTWTSSDESVASVDAYGTVTAISIGEATITATCGNEYATCVVIVAPILAESLTISPETWEGEEGSTFNISAFILPENTTDKSLSWESSDDSVATVETDGTVNVLQEGRCVITVSTLDGSDLKAECWITGISGVDQLFSDPNSRVDVYRLNGILLKRNCSREDIELLQPDIYILRHPSGDNTVFIKY